MEPFCAFEQDLEDPQSKSYLVKINFVKRRAFTN